MTCPIPASDGDPERESIGLSLWTSNLSCWGQTKVSDPLYVREAQSCMKPLGEFLPEPGALS